MIKLKVLYDDWCPNCTRFIKIIKILDWLNYIDPIKLRGIKDIHNNLDTIKAKRQMASFSEKSWGYGYESLYNIFKRIPVLWIFFPVLWILKITGIGTYAYNELALKRKIIPIHCNENCTL